MARDKTTQGNRSKGRIKGSGKLVTPGPEDQRWNMNLDKFKHCVKVKEVIVQKNEVIKGVQYLKIDKIIILVKERSTKMSKQMVKHSSQVSEVTHEDYVT